MDGGEVGCHERSYTNLRVGVAVGYDHAASLNFLANRWLETHTPFIIFFNHFTLALTGTHSPHHQAVKPSVDFQGYYFADCRSYRAVNGTTHMSCGPAFMIYMISRPFLLRRG